MASFYIFAVLAMDKAVPQWIIVVDFDKARGSGPTTIRMLHCDVQFRPNPGFR